MVLVEVVVVVVVVMETVNSMSVKSSRHQW
jgi:hypothetical protein